MKRIFSIIVAIVLMTAGAWSQDVRAKGIIADENLMNPVRDTIAAPRRVGEQRFRVNDSSVYVSVAMTPGVKRWEKLAKYNEQILTRDRFGVSGEDESATAHRKFSLNSNYFFTIIKSGVDTLLKIDPVNMRIKWGDVSENFNATTIGMDDGLGIINLNGNVGVFDASPASAFTVGSGSKFRIDFSGNLVRINNVPYSWPAAQGAANTFPKNDGSGNIAWVPAFTSVINKGFELSSSQGNGVFNIPRNERDGYYISIHRTYVRGAPFVTGSVLSTMGTSYAAWNFCGGTSPYVRLSSLWGMTYHTYAVNASDLSNLVQNSFPSGTMGQDTTTFVDATMPALMLSSSGMPYTGLYTNDHPNDPVGAAPKTKKYIYQGYKTFLTNAYLKNNWFAASSLTHTGFRTETVSDTVGSKSGSAIKGVGSVSWVKPAGETTLAAFARGADGVRILAGTMTIVVGGVTVFSQSLNDQNDANRNIGVSAYALKVGLSYYTAVIKDLPDSAAVVTVTITGDSTWLDIFGYLKPPNGDVRHLYLNNSGYGAGQAQWNVHSVYADTLNLEMQRAVEDFKEYPVWIHNMNVWYDSLLHNTTYASGGVPAPFHLSAAAGDSIYKAYSENLIRVTNKPIKSAEWTSNGNDAIFRTGTIDLKIDPTGIFAGGLPTLKTAKQVFWNPSDSSFSVGDTTGTGGGGGITGSGTDNFVPKWNGTNALENSLIYDFGTGISIGNTTSSDKFNVHAASGNSTASITSVGGGDYSVIFVNSQSGARYFQLASFGNAVAGTRFNAPIASTNELLSVGSDRFTIGTFNAVPIIFGTNSTGRWFIDGSSGHFMAQTDNAYDIGTSGATRPRTGYFGTSLFIRSEQVAVSGNLKSNVTDAGNVGAGEDDLMTYTIPAGLLITNGDYLEFTMTFTFAANANNKQVKIYYGGTTIYASGAQAQNDGMMQVKGSIIRTGATTQRITFDQDNNTTLFTDVAGYTTAGETLSGTVILKATGEATSNDDIVQRLLTVRYFPNN